MENCIIGKNVMQHKQKRLIGIKIMMELNI